MALTIVWTPQAEKGLDMVLEHLQEEWSAKEVLALEERVLDLTERISKYPKSARLLESTRTSAKDW